MKIGCFGFCLFALVIGTLLQPLALGAKVGNCRIEHIHLARDPFRINFSFSQKPLYKVLQIDKQEALIAFKDAVYAGKIRQGDKGDPFFKEIRLEKLPHNAVALVVQTRQEIKRIRSHWESGGHNLEVSFIPKESSSDSAARAKPSAPKTADYAKAHEQKAPEPESIQPQKPAAVKSLKPAGGLEGIVDVASESSCIHQQQNISMAVAACKNLRWQAAFDALSQITNSGFSDPCFETALYLSGYCLFEMNARRDESDYLAAVDIVQEAISYFPNSRYVPYAMALLGKIHAAIKNFSEAQAYFQIILDRYPEYAGMCETLLELGQIYAQKNKLRPAIGMFQKIIETYQDGDYVTEASLALGKALFQDNKYIESLKILKKILEVKPRKSFESPELLLCMGNSYYQIADYARAREVLSKAYNAFPDMDAPDVVLTKIADTFSYAKQPGKALKIYRLVTERYPGSDGFIISSTRMAQFLETPEEKQAIYTMILNDYPDSPMAKLAMLKLADLQNQAAQHEESIGTIKTLLSMGPGELENDALYLIQKSYQDLFKKLEQKDQYPEILVRFEGDRSLLKKYDWPEILEIVGSAYLKAYLYEPAAAVLQKAFDLIQKDKRSPELYFRLGVALHQSNRVVRALKVLRDFADANGDHPDMMEARYRIGCLFAAQKHFEDAILNFESAYRLSKNETEKGSVLIEKAKSYRAVGKLKAASQNLIKAINLFAAAPGNHFDTMAGAYMSLGEIYVQSSSYLKAADAYAMALKFSDQSVHHADLLFRLGESYHKGNVLDMAQKAYQDVVASGDSFWARLAQEKLRGISLAGRLGSS